jgi:hypothetical protein
MKPLAFAALAVCALAGPARAGGASPNPPAANLVNSGFISDRAVSQAKREVARAGADATLSPADANGGNINIASPQIFGRVRGNVTVVMERGAVRGDVTSVRR